MITDVDNIRSPDSDSRAIFQDFGEKWSDLGLSVETFLLLGKNLVSKLANNGLTEYYEEVEEAFLFMYKLATTFILRPVLMKQNLLADASTFFDTVGKELNWSQRFKEKRLFEAHTEIMTTGTYTHTEEELKIGARISWRNSAKCIGR